MTGQLLQFLIYSLITLSGTKGSMNATPVSRMHPFYISVTEVNENTKEKTLEISCKLFADDLEQTLNKNYKTTMDISAEKYKVAADKLIPDYINRHLSLTVNGKPSKLNYVGFEKDKESVYCYLQIDQVSSIKRIDISNSLLHDFNTSEINIMHITVNGHRQSTKLEYPNTQANFIF